MQKDMRYSKEGLALTESFEGCRLKAYRDQVGVWTIGYGHTRGVKQGDACDQAQAEAWLAEDIRSAEEDVHEHVSVDLAQGEYDALVDFVFNLGDRSFEKSTLLRLVNAGDMEHAAQQFERWDMAGGKHVAGLLRRRLAEEKEFLQQSQGGDQQHDKPDAADGR